MKEVVSGGVEYVFNEDYFLECTGVRGFEKRLEV